MSMDRLTLFGLAVTAMLIFYALENVANDSYWHSPDRAYWARRTAFCKALGHLVWSKLSGSASQSGAGGENIILRRSPLFKNMTPKLAFAMVPLSLLGMALPPPQTITTEHADFAPGGLIHINGSYGDLNVEAWDRPGIEVNVINSMPYGYKQPPDQATAHLDGVHIAIERKTPAEATVTTSLPARHLAWSPPFTRHTAGGVSVESEIHVPRDSRLAIHHGTGSVSVSGVIGDIDARAGRGDILLWLPPGAYSLDVRTKCGIVSPDLAGTAHNQHLIGESFTQANPPPAHRLHLRMGFGAITLKEILPESQAPSAR